jgi:Fe-S cluster biogenesis protein NfuA
MNFATDIQARSVAIEEQAQLLERCADPATRAAALDLLRSIMELHRDALERMLTIVDEQENGDIVDLLLKDPLVKSVLVLHDLHPDEIGQRLETALEELRVKLARYGAGVTLLETSGGVVRVRIEAGSHCGSTAESLKTIVEQALLDAAPEAEITVEAPPPPNSTFVPVGSLAAAPPAAQDTTGTAAPSPQK